MSKEKMETVLRDKKRLIPVDSPLFTQLTGLTSCFNDPINEFIFYYGIQECVIGEMDATMLPQDDGEIIGHYTVEQIANFCEAVLVGRDHSDKLRDDVDYTLYADTCLSTIRNLAKIGILALVDEATNYQSIRNKQELQNKFGKFSKYRRRTTKG